MAKVKKKRSQMAGSWSMPERQREIRMRQRRIDALVRSRNRVLAQIARLDEQIAHVGLIRHGSTAGARLRARNTINLADALANALEGKTMSIADLVAALKRAGHRSKARSFSVIVGVTLARDKRFEWVSRGRYTLK